jgi:hypothetical protein
LEVLTDEDKWNSTFSATTPGEFDGKESYWNRGWNVDYQKLIKFIFLYAD